MSSQIKIITGMSGAGKSSTIQVLEDLGYFCVDNLPPELFTKFVEMSAGAQIEKIALVTDIRGRKFFPHLQSALENLREGGTDYSLIFLEASDEVLVRRFKESRRSHPIQGSGTTLDGIKKERELLLGIKGLADVVIDTSNLKTKGLRQHLVDKLENVLSDKFNISISSFGFKYGLPMDADIVMDVRFLPNPFYIESMRNLTGKDKEVYDYVMSFDVTNDFLANYSALIFSLLSYYRKEGKNFLSIAIGCTGGQHRSVVISERLAEMLREKDSVNYSVHVGHRDKPELFEK